MSDIVLSVHPEYADMIFSGVKTVEFRRVLPQEMEKGARVFLYVTAPVKMVVGFAFAPCARYYRVKKAWEKFKDQGGISEEKYLEYSADAFRMGVINLLDPQRFGVPQRLSTVGVSRAPQNFCYVRRGKQK